MKGFVRFILTRGLTLAAALITAVYLTILITNLGGYIDTIIAARIEMQVGMMMAGGWLMDLPVEERMDRAEEIITTMLDEAGLNDPLPIRTVRWLGDGLTLNWEEPERRQDYGLIASGLTVLDVIVDRLSRTLLIFSVANLLMFGAALLFALALNRRYGGLLDRLFVLLTLLSSASAWVYHWSVSSSHGCAKSENIYPKILCCKLMAACHVTNVISCGAIRYGICIRQYRHYKRLNFSQHRKRSEFLHSDLLNLYGP